MPKTKDEVARELAGSHQEVDPTITRIVRLEKEGAEADPNEPIKLLEVNPGTPPDGIVPVRFGPDSDVPFPSVIVDVTPAEYEKVKAEKLQLPDGWRIGEVLFEREEAA